MYGSNIRVIAGEENKLKGDCGCVLGVRLIYINDINS